MRIGVFDSGIGGNAIAAALANYYPDAEILVVDDHKHLPYGNKTHEKIRTLTNIAIQPLLDADCAVIIIACNSATTAALAWLRDTYPKQLFIGVEPMIKTAAKLSRNKIIAVCATPATLSSERYSTLKGRYGASCTFIEPDCSDWAEMIQANQLEHQSIDNVVTHILQQKADVIVLGCTHYHWIKNEIEELAAGKAIVVEPSKALAERLKVFIDI